MRFNFYDLYCDFINSLKNLPKKVKYNFISIMTALKIFIKNFNFIKFVKKSVNALIRPRLPFTLYGMLFKSFLYWYIMIQGLFIVILLIFDLFGKLDKYMSNPVSILNILVITAMFIPKIIGLTIPVAIMFGVSMTLGTFYQNNELIAIFTSRISLFKFSFPIIFFNVFLSIVLIIFDSFVIIPTNRYRDDMFERLTEKSASGKTDNEKLTIRGKENYFWNADKFISSKNMLEKVKIFKINDDYRIIHRIDAENAVFTKSGWLFHSGIIREWDATGDLVKEEKFQKRYFDYAERPSAFKKARYEIDNMTIPEARETIQLYKEINIEHNKELTNYYKKFSFPFTLFIVSLFALGVSTLSRTNILILSLFFSIGLAVLYYVLQMILDILSSTGRVPPIVGAWLPILVFIPVGIYLIQRAKS